MSNRRAQYVMVVILLCSAASSWHAQEAATPPPRALAYSAPLLGPAQVTAMDVDAAGRIYLAGWVCESGLPATANAAQRTYAGGCDGFVAVLGPDRRLEYATYLGGTGQERIWAVDADAGGNVYIAGDTGSADYPATAGAYDTTFHADGLDVFVAKFSATGGLTYSTLLGGTGIELPTGISVDGSGRAHVVGYSNSPDFPTTPGAVSGYHQQDDAFYTRINATGTGLTYSTLVGGAASEYAGGVAFDSAGAAYIAGATDSFDLPTTAAFQPSSGGSTDGWLMKIGADGALKYLTFFGGRDAETIRNIAVRGSSVFLAGNTCSPNLPGAPPRTAACDAAFVAKIASDGSAVSRTAVVDGVRAAAFAPDTENRGYLLAYPSSSSTTTPDAFQPAPTAGGSPLLLVLGLDGSAPLVKYASYAGGGGAVPHTLRTDGAGGVFIGAQFLNGEGQAEVPIVNAPYSSLPGGGLVMHFVPESRMVENVRGEIVLYAQDAAVIRGNWRLELDPSAALGRKLRNPNLGAGKLGAPLAAPADYVEFQFHAEAGVSYHLWMRGRADADNWANDSVFVQFSDSVDASGAATSRIGSTSGASVNLEDCLNCGVSGWGWQDNGYGVLGPPIRFAQTGMHTLRVQRREDGYAFDQVVLSASRYLTSAPGPVKQATTVLAQSNGQPAPATPEIVLHVTGATTHGLWVKQANSGAASGTIVRHPDAGAAKVNSVPVPAVNYFELTFDAEAGRPYHLWMRSTADQNVWSNDSVHVQFSDSVDASGAARWRIGGSTSTTVNLEDCSGCGVRGWGWQDNGWGVGVSGPPIYFASTGRHTIRVTTREDGIGIDQIVLSPSRYLSASPGALKDDQTFLPRTQ